VVRARATKSTPCIIGVDFGPGKREATAVMGGGGTAGGRSVAAARRVQPAEPDRINLDSPVLQDDLLHRVDEDSRRLQENLERQTADDRLRKEMTRQNFAGPLYRNFEHELARYAHSVLRGWMYTGYVFQLLAGRRFRLHASETELAELAADSDLREELATMTVALALPRFKERALVGGGWTYQGGASLPTYFMGACLYVFPNEFRRWRAQRLRWRRQDWNETVTRDPDHSQTTNPAVLAAGNLRVADHLGQLSPREAAIVTMKMDGYTLEEIAETLGEASVRAVEGVLYRWRTREKDLISKGGYE